MFKFKAAQTILDNVERLLTGTLDAQQESLLVASLNNLGNNEKKLAQRLIELAREQERWRRNLMQTAKLAEVGMAMAELIHELRQPLSGISGFAQLISPNSRPQEIANHVKEILLQTTRMERMIERMRQFIRPDDHEGECCADVEAAIQGAIAIFPKMRPGINLEVRIAPQLPKVVAEPQPLVQVFTNLLANANDAQASHGSGIVLIQASYDGRMVSIVIADQGGGISDSARLRLFEPFFTTKGEAGTGLGLYISSQIVNGWGGAIQINKIPPPSFSTAFTVQLKPLEKSELINTIRLE